MKRLLLYLFLFCFANAVFAQQEETVDLKTAGTLANELGENKDNITTLKISGPLNEKDFETLKSMNMLQVLDMGEVSDLPFTTWYNEDLESGVQYRSIPSSAFLDKPILRKVVLPKSLELIGSEAFRGCESLSEVNSSLANNLTIIDYWAFGECTSLTMINFSEKDNLKEIGRFAFTDCNNLRSAKFSKCNQLQIINEYAFNGCHNLSNIDLQECTSIKMIGQGAFSFTSISNFNFFNLSCLEVIEDNSFSNTPLSEELKFPTSLKSLGKRAFQRTNIEKVNFEGCTNLVFLQAEVFSECSNLQDVIFEGCTSLTIIGTKVFDQCYNLKEISFTECTSLNTLNTDAFNGCNSLKNININNGFFKSIDGVLTNNSGELLLYPAGKEEKEYTIPSEINSIASNAFIVKNYYLQKITIPSSIKQIKAYAFSSDYSGTIIMESATPIELSESIGLENAIIIVPEGSATEYNKNNIWGNYNIIENNLEPINIELKEAGTLHQELSDVNILNIRDITISGPINSSDFEFIRKNLVFIKNIDISNAIIENNEIPTNAFYFGYKEFPSYLEKVILPEGITRICEGAFRYSKNLSSINIPSSIEQIDFYAFYQCTSLKNINFQNLHNLQSIGNSAFEGCIFDNIIEFSSSLQYLGYSSFISATPNSIKLRANSIVESHTFENVDFENCKLYVPTGLLEEYKKDSFWGQFKNIEGFGNTVSVSYNKEYGRVVGEGNYEAGETVTLKAECYEPNWIWNDNKYLYFFNGWYDNNNVKVSSDPTYTFQMCDENINLSAKFTKIILNISAPISYNINLELLDYSYNSARIQLQENNIDENYAFFSGWIKDNETISKNKILEISNIEEDCTISANYSSKNIVIEEYKEISDIEKNDNINILLLSSSRLHVTGEKEWKLDKFSYYQGASLLNESPITANNINYIVNGYDNWQFISLPYDIKLSEIKLSENSSDAQFVVRYYDGATRASNGMGSSWKQLSGDYVLKANQGYIFRANNYSEFSFDTETGMDAMFNKKDVTINLQTHASSSPLNANWNLVGNPYPCYYSIKQLFDNGFDSPIIVWSNDIMNYEYYTADDEDAYISPLTSFFVQKNSNNLVFTADGRAAKLTDENFGYLRSETVSDSERVVINLALGNDSMSDKTRVVLNPQASMEYEIGKDATKFESMNPNSPSIFSLDKDNNQLAINERPYDNGVVRIGCKIGVEGNYSISLQKAVNKPIMLHDLETGNICDLSKNAYEFESSTGVFLNRFELRTDIPTSNEMLPEGMSISMNGNNLSVNGVKTNSIIILVDASGKMIYNSKSTGNRVEIRLPMEGVYYLQIVDNMGQKHVQSIKY